MSSIADALGWSGIQPARVRRPPDPGACRPRRALGHTDRAHAVVNPAGTQSGLRSGETLAIVPDQVARGHPDVVELQLGVPAVLVVVVPERCHAAFELQAGGVTRHQDHRLLPVPILAGVGLSHDDEDPGVVVHRSGAPPLAAVHHVLVAVVARMDRPLGDLCKRRVLQVRQGRAVLGGEEKVPQTASKVNSISAVLD